MELAVVGGVASAITIGTTILELSKSLYKSAKKIKYARRALTKLVKEMGIFADLYEDFYRVCVSERRGKGRNTSSTRGLIDWIEDATEAFKVLLKRVRAIAGDEKYSMLETLTAHVKWFFSENEVKSLRSSLTLAQASMREFSNMTFIDLINEEIRMIKDVINQGDRQAIQALEDQHGTTLEEWLSELEQTRRNRRKQRRAIKLRVQKATDELEQQTRNTGDSPIVPESKQLFAFATSVEKYAKDVRKQRRSNTAFPTHSRHQPSRAGSSQPTTSTTLGSSVSKLSPYSEPIATSLLATSTEEINNRCGRCTGICVCSDPQPHPVVPTHPSSPNSSPPPRRAGFEHYSHRFDRSWQETERNNAAHQSARSACPASDANQGVEPDPKPERDSIESEELQAIIEAHIRRNIEPNSSQSLNDEECESDDAEEVGEASEDDAEPSPFRPVAGVQGNRPRHWRNRHERRESPDDHWHRRL